MDARNLLLRVYSVKRIESTAPEPRPDNTTWEVRANSDPGIEAAGSIFYHESDPRALPRLDSLIHVRLDDQLTDPNGEPPTE